MSQEFRFGLSYYSHLGTGQTQEIINLKPFIFVFISFKSSHHLNQFKWILPLLSDMPLNQYPTSVPLDKWGGASQNA